MTSSWMIGDNIQQINGLELQEVKQSLEKAKNAIDHLLIDRKNLEMKLQMEQEKNSKQPTQAQKEKRGDLQKQRMNSKQDQNSTNIKQFVTGISSPNSYFSTQSSNQQFKSPTTNGTILSAKRSIEENNNHQIFEGIKEFGTNQKQEVNSEIAQLGGMMNLLQKRLEKVEKEKMVLQKQAKIKEKGARSILRNKIQNSSDEDENELYYKEEDSSSSEDSSGSDDEEERQEIKKFLKEIRTTKDNHRVFTSIFKSEKGLMKDLKKSRYQLLFMNLLKYHNSVIHSQSLHNNKSSNGFSINKSDKGSFVSKDEQFKIYSNINEEQTKKDKTEEFKIQNNQFSLTSQNTQHIRNGSPIKQRVMFGDFSRRVKTQSNTIDNQQSLDHTSSFSSSNIASSKQQQLYQLQSSHEIIPQYLSSNIKDAKSNIFITNQQEIKKHQNRSNLKSDNLTSSLSNRSNYNLENQLTFQQQQLSKNSHSTNFFTQQQQLFLQLQQQKQQQQQQHQQFLLQQQQQQQYLLQQQQQRFQYQQQQQQQQQQSQYDIQQQQEKQIQIQKQLFATQIQNQKQIQDQQYFPISSPNFQSNPPSKNLFNSIPQFMDHQNPYQQQPQNVSHSRSSAIKTEKINEINSINSAYILPQQTPYFDLKEGPYFFPQKMQSPLSINSPTIELNQLPEDQNSIPQSQRQGTPDTVSLNQTPKDSKKQKYLPNDKIYQPTKTPIQQSHKPEVEQPQKQRQISELPNDKSSTPPNQNLPKTNKDGNGQRKYPALSVTPPSEVNTKNPQTLDIPTYKQEKINSSPSQKSHKPKSSNILKIPTLNLDKIENQDTNKPAASPRSMRSRSCSRSQKQLTPYESGNQEATKNGFSNNPLYSVMPHLRKVYKRRQEEQAISKSREIIEDELNPTKSKERIKKELANKKSNQHSFISHRSDSSGQYHNLSERPSLAEL